MAKGQMKSNKEAKKPKQDKAKKTGPAYLSGSSAPLKAPPKPNEKK